MNTARSRARQLSKTISQPASSPATTPRSSDPRAARVRSHALNAISTAHPIAAPTPSRGGAASFIEVPVKQQYVYLAVLLAASVACQKPAASQSAQASASKPGATATTAPAPRDGSGRHGTRNRRSGPRDAAAAEASAGDLPAVVAKVNGEEIARAEFEATVQNVERRAGRPVPPEQRDQVYRGVLDDLIALRLLKQEVGRRQVTATDAEMADAMKQLRAAVPDRGGLQAGADGAEDDASNSSARRRARRCSCRRCWSRKSARRSRSSRPRSAAFYEKNPDKFQQPEAVHASHVLITVPGRRRSGDQGRRASEGGGRAEAGAGRRRLREARPHLLGRREQAAWRRPRVLPEGTDGPRVRGGCLRAGARTRSATSSRARSGST